MNGKEKWYCDYFRNPPVPGFDTHEGTKEEAYQKINCLGCDTPTTECGGLKKGA